MVCFFSPSMILSYNLASLSVMFVSDCRQEANGTDHTDLTERARAAIHAGPPRRTIGNDDAIFDHDNPKIKEVIMPIHALFSPEAAVLCPCCKL